jgi:hypothetical protein
MLEVAFRRRARVTVATRSGGDRRRAAGLDGALRRRQFGDEPAKTPYQVAFRHVLSLLLQVGCGCAPVLPSILGSFGSFILGSFGTFMLGSFVSS